MPAKIDLIPGWRTASGTHMAGLRIRLDHGWKTYWRAPGDAGFAPDFRWSSDSDVTGMDVHWPTPQVFDPNGVRVIGYRGDVVLPLEFDLRDGAAPARLRGTVDIGVCEDICMPMRVTVDAVLPTSSRKDPQLIAAILDKPKQVANKIRCEFAPADRGMTLSLSVPQDTPPGTQGVVELPHVMVSEPAMTHAPGATHAQAVTYGHQAIARSQVRLTVLTPAGDVTEYTGCR